MANVDAMECREWWNRPQQCGCGSRAIRGMGVGSPSIFRIQCDACRRSVTESSMESAVERWRALQRSR